jgi:uncharacterized membrane protein YkvA (DUF1232 family)
MPKIIPARHVKNVRHATHLFHSRRTLWQMIREAFSGRYKMSFLTTLAIIFGIAYIVFPFDLIPDYIPVLGWIDDGLVLYLILKRLSFETHRYNRQKAMARRNSL